MEGFINTHSSEGLPLGWERAVDPKSGRTFFINHNTRETMWELPQEAKATYTAFQQQQQQNKPPECFEADKHFTTPRYENVMPYQMQQVGANSGSGQGQENPAYAPRPYNIYPNVSPQQRYPQTTQEPLPQYQLAYDFPYPQQQVFQPQTIGVKPSAPVYTGPVQQKLSSTKPRWNVPFPQDENTCAKCQKQYRVLSKGQMCSCCMRKFCSSCAQKKAPVRDKGGDLCVVCDSCFRHISRGDTCCIPRLIPYIAEKGSTVRIDALRELREAAENNERKFITPDEFLPLSTIPVLREALSSKVSREEAECAAATLAKIIMAGTSYCGKQVQLKGCASGAVDAAAKYIEEGVNISFLLSALAGTSTGRKALLDTHRVFRVLSKGLTASSPVVVRNCTHALRGLASMKDDRANQNPEAETELLILSSLSAILAEGPTDPAVRSDALSTVDKLCCREEAKVLFCQSNGVQNIMHALTQYPQTIENNDMKHGASVLYKLAAVNECAPVVASSVGRIFDLCLGSKEQGVKGALLQVIGKLTCNNATRDVVTSLVVARGHDFGSIFSASNKDIETSGLRVILSAISTRQTEARVALTDPGILNTLRRIASTRGPEAQKAIEALAILDCTKKSCTPLLFFQTLLNIIQTASSLKRSGGLNEVLDNFSKKNRNAVNAMVAITSEPGTLGYVLENTKFIPSLMLLLSSEEQSLVVAGWKIIANLSGIPGFGATMYDAGAFKQIHSILVDGSKDLKIVALRTIGQMCVADNMLTGSLVKEDSAMKIVELCSGPDVDVQCASVTTCAEIIACYPPFFTMFSRFGGLDIISNITRNTTNNKTRERATFIMACILSTTEPQNRHLYVGLVPLLTDVMFSGEEQAQVHAAVGLGHFGEGLTEDIERAFLDSGTILALMSAASSENDPLKKVALSSLSTLIKGSRCCCRAASEAGILPTVMKALKTSGTKLCEQCLSILEYVLVDEKAQDEFCANGGLDVLTEICTQPSTAKDEALNILVELASTGRCARDLLDMPELLRFMSSKDTRMRCKAIKLAANFIREDATITQEILSKKYVPYVLECFSEATPNSPEMHDSLVILSTIWKSADSVTLLQLTESLTPEQLLPVLSSEDIETVISTLTILCLEDVSECKILPDLSTKQIVQNLCRAVPIDISVIIPKATETDAKGGQNVKEKYEEEGEEEEGGFLKIRDEAGPKMALYILHTLVSKYPDAVGPLLNQKEAMPYLFAHIGDSDVSGVLLDLFASVLLPALRHDKELKKSILRRRHAHRGIEVLLSGVTSSETNLKCKCAKILSVLAGTPGNAFAAAAEKTRYAQVVDALTTVTKEGTQLSHLLLSVVCSILKSEATHNEIAKTLSFETLAELASNSGRGGTCDLAVTVAGTLACTKVFRSLQSENAKKWGNLIATLLKDPQPNEDATARNLGLVVGFAPAHCFKEAFCENETLTSRILEVATNTYAPKAQILAIRCLNLLGLHSAADAIFDSTIAQPRQSAGVLSETLRFYNTFCKEELWELFNENEKRISDLWDARKTNITPSSLFSLVAVWTRLAENEGIRERMSKVMGLDALKEIAESYPFIEDQINILKIYIGY